MVQWAILPCQRRRNDRHCVNGIHQKGEFAAKLKEKQPDFDPAPVMDLFLHPPVTDDYTLVWGHPDTAGIKKMLCDGYEFSEERVNKALENFTVRAGQKTLENWF